MAGMAGMAGDDAATLKRLARNRGRNLGIFEAKGGNTWEHEPFIVY